MPYHKHELLRAHGFCTNNQQDLKRDTLCGCFSCCHIFSPSQITEWIDDTSGTACCPFCGVDAVIGQSSGYPITPEFLSEMKKIWF